MEQSKATVTEWCNYDANDTVLVLQLPLYPNLREIEIGGGGDVTDWGILGGVAYNKPNVTSIGINACYKVTNKSLFAIAKSCHMLEKINLTDCSGITSDGIAALATSCNKLTEAILDGTNIGNFGVTTLAQSCKDLVTVSVDFCSGVGDEAIIQLGRCCPNLQYIDLGSTQVTDSGVSQIANGCPKLQSFEVSETAVSDIGIKALTEGCPNLSHLNLAYTDVTDQALAYISVNCPELRMLQLCECTEVTDDGLRALANGCSKISEIDLTGTSVSDKGVAYLKSKCPRVMSLRL